MTNEFKIALEGLYKTFSKYPFKSTINGCPCCVSESDKATLHSKKLRELEDEDISRYAFKAMTTWGDVNDFKHYLPRIFELSATKKLMVDTFVVLGKLECGKWSEWEHQEKETILNFLKSWWKYDVNNNGYFDVEVLIEINKITKNLPSLLNDWNVSLETQGFKNYVELVENYCYDLKGKNRTFKELNDKEIQIFNKWIKSKSSTLEKGFFKYEKEDKEFSDRISNSLYMFERIE